MKYILLILATLSLFACKTTVTSNYKPEARLRFDTLSRTTNDYTFTKSVTAEASVSYWFGIPTKQSSFEYRYGLGDYDTGIDNLLLNKSISMLDDNNATVNLARYNMAIENPGVDMFTDYQILEQVDRKVRFFWITWYKDSKIKLQGRGINLRIDK